MGRNYKAIALKYAKDVISGKVVACKWIKLACQRHLDDLDWQDDDKYKFRFDVGAGVLVCQFVELMPHTKGKWAANKQTLIMEPWQVFMTMCFFGWKRKRDNTRRFRKLFLLVPRKNGKSVWAAAIGLYFLVADGEYGAEVFSGATSEKQAWEVFKPARLMAIKSPDLVSHYGMMVNASNINVVSDSAKFEPIIGNPGDGSSPSCTIIDEYHEHATDKMYDTMETGMGARDQPAMIVITTAGDNIAGPCYAMQNQAEKVLSGAREDDELFALIYTIDTEDDDWTSIDTLRKANPNFGVSVGEEFLKSRQKDAIQNARKSGVFKTKHLNVWVQARDAYYDLNRHNKNEDKTLKLDDFEGKEVILGLDLAEKRDLTALSLIFRDQVGEKFKYYRFGSVYLPAGTIELPENEHYRGWRDDGHLVETEGDVTDFDVIYDDILGIMDRFVVREVSFDPWHSQQLINKLGDAGVPCVEYRNTPANMNEPMREIDAAIVDGRWIHDGDPVYTWQLSNVVNRSKTSDLHRPAKERAENKIDSIVADQMALGRWMLDQALASSPWDDEEFVLEVG